MKLKSFEIRSYRSCIKTVIKFNENLTSIIGINGAGKSNILNAVLLLSKMSASRFVTMQNDSSSNKSQINIQIEDKGKVIYLRGDIDFDTDDRNSDDIQGVKIKWNLKEINKKNKWLNIPFEVILFQRGHFVTSVNRRRLFYSLNTHSYLPIDDVSDKVLSILNRVTTFLSSIKYYSASQFSDPSRCPVSLELDENRPVRKSRSAAGHEQFIMDLYKSYKAKGKEYLRYFSAINKNGIGLIDDIFFNEVDIPSSSYEVKSGGKLKKIERNRTIIIPVFSIEGNSLSPNQLSEGTFKTLALLFYILTDNSKLLLIEEPEVCVHHGLLNSILELIKTQSKLKQIIISTHSDYVLDHLSPENIVLIKREKERGTIAKPLSNAMSKNDYEALKTYLDESGNLGEYWREGGLDYEKF